MNDETKIALELTAEEWRVLWNALEFMSRIDENIQSVKYNLTHSKGGHVVPHQTQPTDWPEQVKAVREKLPNFFREKVYPTEKG